MEKTTPHGKPDSDYIQNMFNRLAVRYDLFNHLTSFGLASFWRREALAPLRPGMRVLDLGCGTGDLALGAVRRLNGSGEVVGLDFSEKMLFFAQKRYEKTGLNGHHKIRWALKKAEDLPIESEPYDLVVSGFVLRNLYQNIDLILKGVYRSLKPGGKISFLDITEPQKKWVGALWKFYMTTFTALYGRVLFGKDYPMFYLTESAKRFLNAAEFSRKLGETGFQDVRTRSHLFGVITIYQARKPL